LQLAKENIFIV